MLCCKLSKLSKCISVCGLNVCNTNAYVELTIYLMNINVYPINCSERSMI